VVSTVSERRWVENRPTGGFRRLDVAELWEYRELAGFLALRDLKVRYKQAVFGAAWAIVQPVAGVAVFYFVFRRLANVPSQGIPYPLFAFVGLSVWTYASTATTKATQTLVMNSALVTKVYFPRLLAPLASVLPGLVDLAVSLSLLVILYPVYETAPGLAALSLPLWIIALVIVVIGIGLWLGTLNVTYRDINHGVNLMIQLWLFLSPVAYPSDSVPERFQALYALNPMVGIIDGFRWALLDAPWPGTTLAISFSVAILILVSGIAYFQRSERRFADVI
jgi:ABC-type polysaccharide/polyol phosphate export permease